MGKKLNNFDDNVNKKKKWLIIVQRFRNKPLRRFGTFARGTGRNSDSKMAVSVVWNILGGMRD